MKRIAASADAIYVDPSALLKLYLHEPESRAVAAWRAGLDGPIAVTLFGRVELANAICLAVSRSIILEATHRAALAALDDDFVQGRCVLTDLLWRAALRSADELSRNHTPSLGCRTLDVLHVASAMTLKRRYFLTFDVRQQRLARAAGLKLITLR
jgi:predicted nucleic acid-binding protein